MRESGVFPASSGNQSVPLFHTVDPDGSFSFSSFCCFGFFFYASATTNQIAPPVILEILTKWPPFDCALC